jgi:hypothetical protein
MTYCGQEYWPEPYEALLCHRTPDRRHSRPIRRDQEAISGQVKPIPG